MGISMGFFDKMTSSFKTEIYLTKEENESNAKRAVLASSVIVALAAVAAMATVMYYAVMQYIAIGLTTAIMPYVGTALAIVTASVALGLFVKVMSRNTKTIIGGIEVARKGTEEAQKQLGEAQGKLTEAQKQLAEAQEAKLAAAASGDAEIQQETLKKFEEEKASMLKQLEAVDKEKEDLLQRLGSYESYLRTNNIEDPIKAAYEASESEEQNAGGAPAQNVHDGGAAPHAGQPPLTTLQDLSAKQPTSQSAVVKQ